MILLAGGNTALLEGLAQALANTGQRVIVANSLDEAIDVNLVARALEQVGHFGDAIDEREAADSAQLVVQRVDQCECELGELGHGAADITEQH